MREDGGVPVPLREIPGGRSPLARGIRLAGKVRAKLAHRLWAWRAFRADASTRTFAEAARVPEGALARIFPACELEGLRGCAAVIRELVERHLEHRFDLLGSGWVRVGHGVAGAGVEGHRHPPGDRVVADAAGDWLARRVTGANLAEARRVWRLVGDGYRPIDWQLDFKSGYRWSETTWFEHIHFGGLPGVDVKVPWELARMQHLTLLAHAFALARSGDAGWRGPEEYLGEFRNEVLDFVATNPPRFGVNWQCAMDVAIRVANWLVAYDLFRAAGAVFDGAFEEVFRRSVFEHGEHVRNHLEWGEHFRGNHYLANVAGLLYVAAFLPRSAETDVWLAFVVQELIGEVGTQFGLDGGNFEASINYHRLSAEMVVYGTALVLGLPEGKRRALAEYDARRHRGRPGLAAGPMKLWAVPGGTGTSPFPAWYWERLAKVWEFSAAVADRRGRVPQFGDNDSGRFLKLVPVVRRMETESRHGARANGGAGAMGEWVEDGLNHEHLLAAFAGLGGGSTGAREGDPRWRVEAALVRDLAGGLDRPGAVAVRLPLPAVASGGDGARIEVPVLRVFREFGVVVGEAGPIRVVMRCGPVGQCGIGGHAHNDQLSFELTVGGRALVVDPGTYLYTPLQRERNAFRAVAAHSTLAIAGREQNRMVEGRRGLFCLREQARARLTEAGEGVVVMEHCGFGEIHRRTLRVTGDSLCGRDECAATGRKSVSFPIAPGGWRIEGAGREVELLGEGGARVAFISSKVEWIVVKSRYSAGYGRVEENQMLRLEAEGDLFEWEIRVKRA